MYDCMVVEFALVAYRRDDIALQKCGPVENHERLIRIARENHLIEESPLHRPRPRLQRELTGDTLFGPAG